jgi:hypothetical protein
MIAPPDDDNTTGTAYAGTPAGASSQVNGFYYAAF